MPLSDALAPKPGGEVRLESLAVIEAPLPSAVHSATGSDAGAVVTVTDRITKRYAAAESEPLHPSRASAATSPEPPPNAPAMMRVESLRDSDMQQQ